MYCFDCRRDFDGVKSPVFLQVVSKKEKFIRSDVRFSFNIYRDFISLSEMNKLSVTSN